MFGGRQETASFFCKKNGASPLCEAPLSEVFSFKTNYRLAFFSLFSAFFSF